MKQPFLLLTCILLLAFSGILQGQVLLTLTPIGSTTISPGGEVTFDVNLTVSGGESVWAVNYQLLAPASDQFTLLTFDNSTSIFNQFGSTDVNDTPLNPNSLPLTGSATSPVGDGTYYLAQITLQASPTLGGGSYELETYQAMSTWTDSSLNGQSFSLPVASIEIAIAAPEPSTWAMLLSGILLMAILFSYRRTRGHSSS